MFKSEKILGISLLILVFILSVGAVSAANNTPDSNTLLTETNNASNTVNTVNVEDVSNSTGSFSDLQGLIDKDTSGNISLDRNYTYNSGSDDTYGQGVIINKNLTINGNGYTINGDNQACLINIYDSTVNLNGLNFINGNSTVFSVGGGVYAQNSTVIIGNCNFSNNTCPVYGGAISSVNSTITITDSGFNDNQAKYGGAINTINSNLILINNKFITNTASYSGGAILNYNSTSILENNTFTANTALASGGAIWTGNGTTIMNENKFFYNIAYRCGGAIYTHDDLFFSSNSLFIINMVNSTNINNDNLTYGGGAIGTDRPLILTNTTFFNNIAVGDGNNTGRGGAIYIRSNETSIIESNFINNTASTSGGAIYTESNLTIDNSRIIENEGLTYNTNLVNNGGYLNISNSIILNPENGYIALINGTGILNNNWWGSNKNPTENVKNIRNSSKITLDTWVIMTLTINPTNITSTNYADLLVKLNQYTDGEKIYNMTSLIPDVEVKITITDISTGISENATYFTINNTYDGAYLGTTVGQYNVTATINNQNLSGILTVNPLENESTIIDLPYYNFVYGENQLTGYLIDINGNLLENKTISLNLTNLLNPAWKIYNVTTNEDGEFNLPITLNPGVYMVNAIFNGDKFYKNSTSKALLNIANSKLNTEDLIINNTKNNKFNGTLTTINATPLENKNISVTITRSSDGVYKTYTLKTNTKGEFTLPINLNNGEYTVETIYHNGLITSYQDNYISINPDTNRTTDLCFLQTYYTENPKEIIGRLFQTSENYSSGIPNQNITIQLTRLSDSASKNYTVSTDNQGKFTLPINLDKGEYIFQSIFTGSETYTPTINTDTFTVE